MYCNSYTIYNKCMLSLDDIDTLFIRLYIYIDYILLDKIINQYIVVSFIVNQHSNVK